MSFQLEWSEPRGCRRGRQPPPSRAMLWVQGSLGTALVLGGLTLVGMNYFGERLFSKLVVVVSVTVGTGVLCLLALPLLYLLARDLCPTFVTVGPKGISLSQPILMGHHVITSGWTLPWNEIAALVYLEDVGVGKWVGRVLLVTATSGRQKLAGIADEVTREQIAGAVEAWGKVLEVMSDAAPEDRRRAAEAAGG